METKLLIPKIKGAGFPPQPKGWGLQPEERMKINIVYLLLIALLGITVSASIAQQNQNVPKTDTEVEAVKKRVSELEGKLQTVENVEKMELAAKLAEANAKLINTDIDKVKGELRESNNDWLRAWNNWFLGIVSVIAVIIGGALWLVLKTLIEKGIEKKLNGFQEAVKQVDILKDQLRVLRKEQAASMMEATFQPELGSELGYPKENKARREEALKEISEEALLDVFSDEKYLLAVRHKAAEVLAQKSPPLVAPLLQLLNIAIDPDSNTTAEIGRRPLRNSVSLLGKIETRETYEALTKFLSRLLTENPKHKDLFLTDTAFYLFWIGLKLNIDDSVSVLRLAIPHLQVGQSDLKTLQNFAKYFDIFNNPEGIKEIFNVHAKGKIPELEEKCLELLEKYDPDFVKEQREEKATANPKSEES